MRKQYSKIISVIYSRLSNLATKNSAKTVTLKIENPRPRTNTDRCHGDDRQHRSGSLNGMPRIALLPDQLYDEPGTTIPESEDSDEGITDFREQYAREVRKIRENIRAIRRIKARGSRSSAASSTLPPPRNAGRNPQLRSRSASCCQLQQQRPHKENGKCMDFFYYFDIFLFISMSNI